MAENQSAEALWVDLSRETGEDSGTDWGRYEAAKREIAERVKPGDHRRYEIEIERILEELNL